jgi:hypothetical protein
MVSLACCFECFGCVCNSLVVGARGAHRMTHSPWRVSGISDQSFNPAADQLCTRLQDCQAGHWQSAARQLRGSIQFGHNQA